MSQKRHWRVRKLSEEFGIPSRTIYSGVERGEIEAIRIGKAVYIPRRAVEKLIGESLDDDQAIAAAPAATKQKERNGDRGRVGERNAS